MIWSPFSGKQSLNDWPQSISPGSFCGSCSESKSMTDAIETSKQTDDAKKRTLKDALHVVKNRQADRDDVVVDMKAAEETRLELLADELRPLLEEIDQSDERFEFALSRGERPRFWIDMTSFVAMGHDRRTYRFLKDTRAGRMVLAEGGDMEKIADSVSQYIAERVLERERAIEGEWMSLKRDASLDAEDELPASSEVPVVSVEAEKPVAKSRGGFWRSVLTFLFGSAVTLALLGAAAMYLVPDAF